jgi:ubiquinone biosynthesis accessory factor UbiJ
MPRYLTPLPALLARAIEGALGQAIEMDPAAATRLKALDGRVVKLVLERLGIDLFFIGQGERLVVVAESQRQADTVIQGSPSALLAMAVPDWRAPGSGVRIEGDAGSAQALEKLLKQLDPDFEALLSRHLGDVLGHQVWRLLRDAGGMARHGARTAGDQLARYLREESGLLVTREEMTAFSRDVDELREAADRLEARLRRAGKA